MIDALERCTRAVNRAFALAASVLVLAIVAIILREVVFRYALNAPSIWALDSARFALLFVFFLALAPALESGHHVHVDLFDPIIPARLHWYFRVAGYVLSLLFGAVLNLWFWPYIAPGGLPPDQVWRPGAGLSEATQRYAAFYLATSLWWDIWRGVGWDDPWSRLARRAL